MVYYRSELNITAIDKAYEIVSNIFKTFQVNPLAKELKTEINKHQYHRFIKKDEESIHLHVKLFREDSSYLILKSPANMRFYSSDNPCFKVKEEIGSIVFYFPISPEYCVLVCVDKQGTFSAKNVSEEELNKVNKLIYESSAQKIIMAAE